MNIIRIPSRLYSELYFIGGDRLVSVFCILKAYSNESKYLHYTNSKGRNIGGYGLIRKQTNISLTALKKYVPQLVEMGLITFESNGDVTLLGNNKLKEKYSTYYDQESKTHKKVNKLKLIPIKIGKNLTDTAINCSSVRFHSNVRKQNNQIAKKKNLSELKRQATNTTSLEKYKAYKKALRDGKFDNLTITDDIRLSNEGYALIKCNERDNKSKGEYWKRKLTEKGIVKHSRNYEFIKRMSFNEFKLLQKMSDFNPKFIYYKGFLCLSSISSLIAVNVIA